MKHKRGDLIGGNTNRAILLDETQTGRFDWKKHNQIDFIGRNTSGTILLEETNGAI